MFAIQRGQGTVGEANRPFEVWWQPAESACSRECRAQESQTANHSKAAAHRGQPSLPARAFPGLVGGQTAVSDKHPANNQDDRYEDDVQNSPCRG
jgi:hypothetical protein